MNFLLPLVVLVPLVSAALAMMLPRRRRAQQAITVSALLGIVVISVIMMFEVDANGALTMEVGGWAAPFGIMLVALVA